MPQKSLRDFCGTRDFLYIGVRCNYICSDFFRMRFNIDTAFARMQYPNSFAHSFERNILLLIGFVWHERFEQKL